MKKVLLYLSAFVPLYILLIVKIVVQLINKNLSINVLNTLSLSLLCLLVGLGIVGLLLGLNSGKAQTIIIVKATNITEKHFLGYFSLFVLFALGYQIELVCMAVIFAIILVLIGVVYIRNNLFYINPLLNILGYSFYSVEYKIDGDSSVHTANMIFFGKLQSGATASAKMTTFNFNLIEKIN